MSRIFLALAGMVALGPAWAGGIGLPSGQTVELVEILQDATGPAGLTYRYRFLAPAIARDGGSVSAPEAMADIEALCAAFVIPHLAQDGGAPAQVVVSLADRPVDFGVASPEATQYFDAFRVEGGTCIWEGY